MRLWPFGKKVAPAVSDAARALAAHRKSADRALIRATARKMREERGLAPDPALRDR